MSAVGQASGHASLMDAVYRRQRHVYDLTRKYYLLGRDRLLSALDVPSDGTVLELGCGTGRNIVLAARRYPAARFFGLDISAAMLETAQGSLMREGIASLICYFARSTGTLLLIMGSRVRAPARSPTKSITYCES